VIVTDGMSKAYSAGGWRIGYSIIVNSTIRTALLAYASEAWSSASSPSQCAAIVAYSTNMESYRNTVAQLHKLCTIKFYNILKDLALQVAEPKGAFYVYPSFSPYSTALQKLNITNSRELSKWLLQECGIATLPGSSFGEDDEGGVQGGKFRVRMATSCLWFKDETERYSRGYHVLEGDDCVISNFDEAVKAITCAIEKLKGL